MNILRPMGSLLLGLFLSLPNISMAQCPAGDVILGTQAEVDQFVTDYPNCIAINGSLTIGDDIAPIKYSDISDLSGLTSIANISGNLNITANPNLLTLNGLSGITEISGSLNLIDNAVISDIDGMVSLGTVMLYVNIIDNNALTNINGWNDLIVNFILTIKDNDNLIEISGFNNLVANRAVVIAENAMLTTISGMGNINAGLTFALMDNPLLTDVSGFSFGTNLSPVAITGNTLLEVCSADGICDAVFAGLANSFGANAPGCSTALNVLNTCLLSLPVSLVEFKASLDGQKVVLQWKTASEQNNKGFEVEYSLDGKSWSSLAFINGHGNSEEFNSYFYVHEQPLGAKNYYRLKQVDFDGQYEYSVIEKIQLSLATNKLVNVFPNPTEGPITIQLATKANTKTLMRLFDIRGQIVWEENLVAPQETGLYIKHLELTGNQLYFLFTQRGSESEVIKIQAVDIY